MATIEQLLGKSPEELESMSDQDLLDYFKTNNITEPTEVFQIKTNPEEESSLDEDRDDDQPKQLKQRKKTIKPKLTISQELEELNRELEQLDLD